MFPGARIIKSGIAVAITVFICSLLGLEPAMFGAVSAVINIQPSIRLTLSMAREQLVVHALGVLVAFAVGFSLGASPLTMGLVVMIIIWLYARLQLEQGIIMGIVAAMFVITSAPEQFVSHAVSRTVIIFIGLFVASIVNVILFRPRYEDKLLEQLRRANQETVDFFVRTMQAFAASDSEYFAHSQARFAQISSLLDECLVLAEFYIHEETNFSKLAKSTKAHKLVRFIEYNRSMLEKTWEISEIMDVRLKRRLAYGDPPISKDFQEILDMLLSINATIIRINQKLRATICDGLPADPEPIVESPWEELKDALEQWQIQNSGSYYLHALLDLSVVAANIRWVARHGKGILGSTEAK